MDDEPPTKISKSETPSRYSQLRSHHLSILERYGISETMQTTRVIRKVPNEVIVALIFLKQGCPKMYQLIKHLLGLQHGEERSEMERFRRAVATIEKDDRKEKKRETDKYLLFSQKIAFDCTFFGVLDVESQNSNILGKKIEGQGNVLFEESAAGHTVFEDKEVQAELPSNIDLTDPSKSPDFIKNFHQNCLSQFVEQKEKYKKLRSTIDALRKWKKTHENLILKAKKSNCSLKKAKNSLQNLSTLLEKKQKQLANALNDLKVNKEVLHEALTKLDSYSGVVELKEGKKYSNKTFEAVISLKSLGVADEKVGDVMSVVAKLIGVKFNSVPSPSTCRNFALDALYLGNCHVKNRLSDQLENGEPLCLASDETTKGTVKLQSFGVYSLDGTFTCLGVVPVPEKSAQTALNALETTVAQLPEAPPNFFDRFLVSVKSTMSDSARTEIKFNELVEEWRKKAIPQVVNDYSELSESEKKELLQFSQHFCQLHVISNYTDVVLKCLVEHELMVEKKAKLSEPSVFVLIKLVSQLFGERGSGMHGILQLWTAWCKNYSVNRFNFPAFIGNRFNIVFVLASRVFFHRHHLIEFTKECDSSKPALKEIRALLEKDMIIEHLHVLGLCDELVTGPLWRLAEGSENILDTCKYSVQLQKWLITCTENPTSFFAGASPTPSLQVDSPTNSLLLLQALVNRDPTEMGADVAILVCNSSLEYFNRAFVNFLPGGKHCNEDSTQETDEPAPATNRNIESVFGLMSHFFATKPNMRIDVRVAFTLLKKNNTISWLQSLPEAEQDQILTDSRKQLKALRDAANSRQLAIDTVILRQMKEKNTVAVKKQAKDERDRCRYTKDVLVLGFWNSSAEIQAGLAKLDTDKQKTEAIISQLRFRKFVIRQTAPSSLFSVSSKSKAFPLSELIKKLETLIASHQGSQQILLLDHDYIGKKLTESSTSKKGFVQDIRIVGHKKTITVQFDGDDDTTVFDFESFEADILRNSIVFA